MGKSVGATVKRVIEAAGGIVYRRRRGGDGGADGANGTDGADESRQPGEIEVCLVHRPKYGDWSWPKGKLDPNESHRHAAVREIGEETGVPVALGPYLGEVEYPLNEEGKKSRHTKNRTVDSKHVLFWMATPISEEDGRRRGAAFGPVHRADAGEIDEVRWLTVAEARKKLSHSTDKDLLATFVDRIEEGAERAVPFLLVRHGKAEPRKSWKGSDANRPLTPRGAACAFALSHELACFNPVRLCTSPWIRCMETIEMFSWQTDRRMVMLEPLTEDAFAAGPEAAWRCFYGEMLSALERHTPTAVCMHRPVIGGMFEHLRGLCASKSLAKRLIAKSPYMTTGTALALFAVPEEGGAGVRIIDIQKVVPLVY
ncbi:NUDIX hydrolase [Bifidobacterium panos]|uniref:NUDIX hydrolase n=1 Tax=Bifidobacterium panos TaxID=2675321 RepID=UPI003AA86339